MTTGVKPQDKTVSANGLNLHYLDWGNVDQPTVVLLHGLRGHAHSWDDVSTALCQDFHVLALDQRGRGETDWAPGGDYSTEAFVADLHAFCEAIGLGSFILIGHSMGGRNSMAFTGQYPDMVEKLVIIDIGPVIDPAGGQRITQEIKAVPEEFDSFEDVVAYMSKQNRFASDTALRRRLQYATKQLANGKIGWRYDLEVREQRRNGTGGTPADLWPAVRNTPCPTLIVRGADTDTLSADMAKQMEETYAQGQLVLIPRAGHMVFEDNPEDFITAVGNFLK